METDKLAVLFGNVSPFTLAVIWVDLLNAHNIYQDDEPNLAEVKVVADQVREALWANAGTDATTFVTMAMELDYN